MLHNLEPYDLLPRICSTLVDGRLPLSFGVQMRVFQSEDVRLTAMAYMMR